MKNIFITAFLAASALLVSSCSGDDDVAAPAGPQAVETVTVSNFFANQTGGQGGASGGSFAKFSFSQNAAVTGDDWDIAFRGTTLLINGGDKIGIDDEPARTGTGAASIVTGTYNSVTQVPATAVFTQDGPDTYAIPIGSDNGWYIYDSTNHLITPKAGRILLIKTHDGKYAKMEILSYYQNAPANPTIDSPSRYFTFKFAYQPDGTTF
ncbi:HmuY family protein [Flavobacterium sp. RHBU_24]|uniref:HmuY family protein n=1 Tax=Flavobacterium sp. RHBU_24 TaxID=3391185 RepID=UPI0039848A0B